MKRILTVLFLSVFVMGTSNAQIAAFGLKGGLNFSSLPELQTGQSAGYVVSAMKENQTGFHVGLTSLFRFGGFYLQPEFLFTQTERDMLITTTGTSPTNEPFTQVYRHLSLPVQAGLSLGPLKIGGGPVLSFFVDHSNDLADSFNFDQVMNDVTLGYQLGIGVVLGKLMIDLRFEDTLSRFGTEVNIGGQSIDFDTRPRQYILSVGLLF